LFQTVYNVHLMTRWLEGWGTDDTPTGTSVFRMPEYKGRDTNDASGDLAELDADPEAAEQRVVRRLTEFTPFFLVAPSTGFYCAFVGAQLWSSSEGAEEFLWLPYSLAVGMFFFFFFLLGVRLILIGQMEPAFRPLLFVPLANLCMMAVGAPNTLSHAAAASNSAARAAAILT
jgi:hypothetical protein